MHRHRWQALLGLALVAVAYPPSARAEQAHAHLVLRMAHSLDVSHPVHRAMLFMGRRLEALSHGRMQLKVYPNSQLGSEREMVELVQLGALDLVKTSTSPLEGFIPGMAVFSVPYLFRDPDHYWEVLDGPLGRRILDLGISKKLKGLCYYDAGSRSFYTRDRPILRPSDLRGMKIRVQNSRTAIRMIEAMGGSATPIAFGELYSALDQGVVDGAENNPPSLWTSHHFEVCKHYSLDEHTRVPDVVLIGTERWDRLSPRERAWIQQAADESARFQRELWARETAEIMRKLQDAGVKVYHPDKRPFQEAVQPLYETYRGTVVGELIEAIRKVGAGTVPSDTGKGSTRTESSGK